MNHKEACAEARKIRAELGAPAALAYMYQWSTRNNERRKQPSPTIEHDRRRQDPQVFFNRLRVWEAFIVGLLIVLLSCLFVASQAHAAEFPPDVTVCKIGDDGANPVSPDHKAMCHETAVILANLVYASHLPCERVIGQIMSPARKAFFVTCTYFQYEAGAVRAVYANYRSINGHAFKPSAPDGRDYFVSN